MKREDVTANHEQKGTLLVCDGCVVEETDVRSPIPSIGPPRTGLCVRCQVAPFTTRVRVFEIRG